ncbi:MAG: InlB B-repeat-containing protein [Treponema sp.]|nr:InlB B-repeat-containing protein [Treponema sp.]
MTKTETIRAGRIPGIGLLLLLIFLFSSCEIFFLDMAAKHPFEEGITITLPTIRVVFDPANGQNRSVREVVNPSYTISDIPNELIEEPPINSPPLTLFSGWFVVDDDGMIDKDQRFTSMTPVREDMVVQALWRDSIPNTTPIVTFDSTGSHRPSYPREKVPDDSGSLPYLPEEPRLTGFVFMGWMVVHAEGPGTQTGYLLNQHTTINHNITVQPVWVPIEPNEVVITFNSNGALVEALPMRITVRQGSTLESLPSPPSWNGYAFNGWNRRIDGTGAQIDTGLTINQDMTVYAQWRKVDPDKRVVNFNSNGGSYIPSAEAYHNETLTPPQPPTRRGYTFARWYKNWDSVNNAPTDEWIFATDFVDKHMTLFAGWNPREYRVVFDLNGGGGATPGNISNASFVDTVSLPGGGGISPPASPPDQVFDGWSSSISGGTIFRDGQHAVEELLYGLMDDREEIRLYARWRHQNPDTVILSFNSLGGTFVESVIMKKGETTPSPAVPIRRGYTFNGWFPQNGTAPGVDWGTPWSFGGDTVDADTTLYARWNPISYTINFNVTGSSDSPPGSRTRPFNGTIELPDGSSFSPPANQEFAGWSFQPTGGISFRPGDHDMEVLLAGLNLTGTPTLILYAQWRPVGGGSDPVYSVNFNLNGGTMLSHPAPVHNLPQGAIVPDPGDPTMAGHSFAGWYTALTGGSLWVFGTGGTQVNANTTLFALWDPVSYAIAYNRNDLHPGTLLAVTGTLPADLSGQPYDSLIDLGAQGTLAKPGHLFRGWNTAADGTGLPYLASQAVRIRDELALAAQSGTITLYAQWEAQSYRVTFNSNGAQTSPSPATADNSNNWVVANPGTPTRTGYDFRFWADGSTEWDFDDPLFEPTTLTAQWSPRQYRVVYNSNHTGTNETHEQPATGYISFTEPPTIVGGNQFSHPNGDTFLNWNTAPGTNTLATRYHPGQSLALLDDWGELTNNSTINLYAHWEPPPSGPDIRYSVTFNLNGGIMDGLPSHHNLEPTADIPNPGNPTRTGHTFLGWFPALSGGEAWVFQNTSGETPTPVGTSNRTLYARWQMQTYTITYHANAGSETVTVPADQSALYSDPPTIGDVAPTARPGWHFLNWSTVSGTANLDANKVFPGQSAAMHSGWGGTETALNLYAQWEQLSYTVSFNSNGGDPVASETGITYGTSFGSLFTNEELPIATLTGYDFMGWYTQVTGGSRWLAETEVTQNITLFARWQAKNYMVQYFYTGGKLPDGVTEAPTSLHTYNVPKELTKNIFIRDGHTFTGWLSTDNVFFHDEQTVVNLMTTNQAFPLYAQWEELRHTVTFNSLYNIATSPQQILDGELAEEPSPDNLTRTGYEFMGWYETNSTGGTWGSPFDFTTPIKANLTLYARWDPIVYTVRLHPNGALDGVVYDVLELSGAPLTVPAGEEQPAPREITLQYGQEYLLPYISDTFTREGHNATGWNTRPNASSSTAYRPIADGQILINLVDSPGVIDLYIQWQVITHLVSFNLNGATGNFPPQFVQHGSNAFRPLTDPTPPTHPVASTKFTFEGWTTDYLLPGELLDPDMHYKFDSTPVTEPIILYAILGEEHLPLNVSFSWNWSGAPGGPPDQKVFRNGILDNPNNHPTRQDFAITGWYTRDGTEGNWGDLWHFTSPVQTSMHLYARWEGEEDIPPQWTSTLAGSSSGDARFNATAVHPATGDIYAVGYITGADFNFGKDPSGNDVKISGSGTTPSPVIVKYNSEGEVLWAKSTFSGTNAGRYWDLAISIEGSNTYIYAVGELQNNTTASNFDFGNGHTVRGPSNYYNPVAVKYRDDGTTMWARTTETLSGDGWQIVYRGVAVNSTGVYIAGYFEPRVTATFGNNVSISSTDLDEQPMMVKYNHSGLAQWGYIVESGGGNGNQDSRFNAITVTNVTENGTEKTYIYAVGYQRRNGTSASAMAQNNFNYGKDADGNDVRILPFYSGTTMGNVAGHNAVIVKFEEITGVANTPAHPHGTYVRALYGEHLHIDLASEFNTVLVSGNYVYAGGMLDHRPVVSRFDSLDLRNRTSIRAQQGTANPNTNFGNNLTTNRNNTFINYINSLAVDSEGHIWAAGSLHGTTAYEWDAAGGYRMYPTGVSGNSVVLKINSDFTLTGTFSADQYNAPAPMPYSKLMRRTLSSSAANLTANEASNNRAVLMGIAIHIDESGNNIVYAVGYQRYPFLYDHGNNKPAAAANTGNHDKPVILRY